MSLNLRDLAASTILALILTTVPAFAKTPVCAIPITVRLFEYVNLPASARNDLTANARRVLGQAGIAVEFVECYSGGVETSGPPCTGPFGPSDVVLRIVEPKLAAKGEQLGYAAMTSQGGAYITVFINPVQQKARIGNLSNGAFLGHAVAHEIGHLLLGANSHSSAGIMRPKWRPVDEEWMVKGALLFGAAQGAKMRSTLTDLSSR
jgi:hypothetical protein